jgi:hypothetical protein
MRHGSVSVPRSDGVIVDSMGDERSAVKAGRLQGADLDDDASDERERDTVKPAFDVEEYAARMSVRARLPTIVDEEVTEQARLASVLMDSNPPAPAAAPVRHAEFPSARISMPPRDEQEISYYRARLAPMSRVPALVRTMAELATLSLDPKTAYVLGFVDGILPLEMIVEVAGIPELEALRILETAVDQYVITFRERGGA